MFVLDTHVVVWIAAERVRMSAAAIRAIDQARARGEGLFIADATLFELASLMARNRIRLEVSLESFLHEVEAKFIVTPIDRQIAARACQFPDSYPKDPTDRLIGATAIVQGVPLITADERIRRSKALQTIW